MLIISYTNKILRNILRWHFTQAIVFVHHKCPNSAKTFLPEGTSALTPLSRSDLWVHQQTSIHERKQGCQSNIAPRKRPITGEPALPGFPPTKCQKVFLSSEQNVSCERLSDVRATRKCSRVPDLLARSPFPRLRRSALSVRECAVRICALAGNYYACEII